LNTWTHQRCLDGGIGGFATAKTAYFLNTNYIFWRPHAQRNMVTLDPEKRYSINQDASVSIIAWAGAMTCSGRQYQGAFDYAVIATSRAPSLSQSPIIGARDSFPKGMQWQRHSNLARDPRQFRMTRQRPIPSGI
jgi:hypothetical protein